MNSFNTTFNPYSTDYNRYKDPLDTAMHTAASALESAFSALEKGVERKMVGLGHSINNMRKTVTKLATKNAFILDTVAENMENAYKLSDYAMSHAKSLGKRAACWKKIEAMRLDNLAAAAIIFTESQVARVVIKEAVKDIIANSDFYGYLSLGVGVATGGMLLASHLSQKNTAPVVASKSPFPEKITPIERVSVERNPVEPNMEDVD